MNPFSSPVQGKRFEKPAGLFVCAASEGDADAFCFHDLPVPFCTDLDSVHFYSRHDGSMSTGHANTGADALSRNQNGEQEIIKPRTENIKNEKQSKGKTHITSSGRQFLCKFFSYLHFLKKHTADCMLYTIH